MAAVSFLGFLVFLATVLLRAPPSALLPNRPAAGRKVSVVLVPEDPAPSRLLEYCQQIATVLSEEHLEMEFLVVGGVTTGSTLQPLRDEGHHVEVLQRHKHFSQTVASAIERAHFSLLLVLGDLRVSVERVVPALVSPLVKGSHDISLAQYSDKSLALGLLSYPLTLTTVASGNSTVFCLHKAVWMKGCPGVSPVAASTSLEFLAKCDLHHHSTVSLLLPSPQTEWGSMLAQVCWLYWELYPLWCVCGAAVVVALCAVVGVRTYQTSGNASWLDVV